LKAVGRARLPPSRIFPPSTPGRSGAGLLYLPYFLFDFSRDRRQAML